MKNLCLLITLLVIISFGACNTLRSNKGSDSPNSQFSVRPDSLISNNLGEPLTLILFSPDSVLAAKLSEKSIESKFSTSKSFEKSTVPVLIESNDLKMLQLSLLADPLNYKNDSIIVMSPCIPAMEIDFFKDGEQANIIISFSDHSWMLNKNDKKIFDYNFRSEETLRKIYQKL